MEDKVQIGIGVDAAGADVPVKNLKQQLRAAVSEAQILSQQDMGSAEAIKAQKKVANLKEEISDLNKRVEALNPEAKFKAVAQVAQGVAGGFAAAQGAAALFGAESEDLQKTLLKVQGALALSQGLNSIMEMKDAFGNLAVVVRTSVVSAFGTLRAAIISTGIIGLVAVLGGLLYSWYEDKKAVEENAKSHDDLEKALRKTLAAEQDLNIELLEGRQKEQAEAANKRTKQIIEQVEKIKEIKEKASKENREITAAEAQEVESAQRQMMIITEVGLKEQNALTDKYRKEDLQKEKEAHDKKLKSEKDLADKSNAIADLRFKHYLDQKEEERKLQDDFEKARQNQIEDDKVFYELQAEIEKANTEIAKKEMEARLSIYSAVGDGIKSLASIAGEQTEAGKALAVAAATIDTYVAAWKAYKGGFDVDPTGVYSAISATAAVVAGIANVQKILSVTIPNVGQSGGVRQSPSITAPTFVPHGTDTGLGKDITVGQGREKIPPQRVYVVEADIKKVTGRVDVIESRSHL